MVHLREGGGKISSPHSVEYFGDQKPPKMGRCDLDWIIIFFSSILMLLEWKKWRNQLTGPFLPVGPSLENWGLKPSGSILRHQMTFFGGKFFVTLVHFFFFPILHTNTFPMMQESPQSESVCKSYATQKLTFLFSPP
jgi:hypothetical protein